MIRCPKCHYGMIDVPHMDPGPPPQGYGVPKVTIVNGSCYRCGYTPPKPQCKIY